MNGLKRAGVELDRKVLSDMAIADPAGLLRHLRDRQGCPQVNKRAAKATIVKNASLPTAHSLRHGV